MENLEPLYDRTINCLCCKNTYTTKKIRSRFIKAVAHDTDFCSLYHREDLNPLLYYVSVCPQCGFSSSEEFSSYFPPDTLKNIHEKINTNWSGSDYCGKRTVETAINTYKLAIYSATLKKEKHIAIAGLYMRLAWIFRTYKEVEQELRFTDLALTEYIQAYIEDECQETHMSEVRLLYLIGELSRRTEKKAQAIQYFSKVIQKQNETIEKGIIQMARDRWQDIREEQRQAN